MNIIKICVLIFFTFSHLNGMEALHQYFKYDSALTIGTAIVIPSLIFLCQKLYKIINPPVAHVDQYFHAQEKLSYVCKIFKLYGVSQEVNKHITQFLRLVSPQGSNLSFVLSHMVYHAVRREFNFSKKMFFKNKKFYWKKDFSGNLMFYNDQNVAVFRMGRHGGDWNTGENFTPAHNSNIILTHHVAYVRIYNIETGKFARVGEHGELSKWDLSPDGCYVALCYDNRVSTIDIYDISDMDSVQQVASVDHLNLEDFIFSPCSSKLVSWSAKDQGEVILWNLSNIKEISTTVLSKNGCGQVIFNGDSKHLCILPENASHYYQVADNKFRNAEAIIINIDDLAQAAIKLPKCKKMYVFSHNSDLIMCKQQQYTHFVTMTGTRLELPEGIQHFRCGMNSDYICAHDNGNLHVFDHQMRFITQINCDEKITLELDSENAIIGQLPDSSDVLYWPLPNGTAIKTLQDINQNLTAEQFVSLEIICSHKRRTQESFVLKNKGDLMNAVFKSFSEDHQSYLKERLCITES